MSMKTTRTRNAARTRKAIHVATVGRERVPVYERTAPNGSACFMVVNYSTSKRQFDSYADAELAIEAAGIRSRRIRLARRLPIPPTQQQPPRIAMREGIDQSIAPCRVQGFDSGVQIAG